MLQTTSLHSGSVIRGGTSLDGAGSNGFYWSSSLFESNNFSVRILGFDSDSHNTGIGTRWAGYSVRPVLP